MENGSQSQLLTSWCCGVSHRLVRAGVGQAGAASCLAVSTAPLSLLAGHETALEVWARAEYGTSRALISALGQTGSRLEPRGSFTR